jgi:uridylate kinase
MGKSTRTIEPQVVDRLAQEISSVHALGVQIGIVVGGGNFFRGAALSEIGINRITGDYMGMLATLMNALALRDAFERSGLPVRVLSAIPMGGAADLFDRRKAIHHLQQGRIVLLAGGTGNPLVTTDSAASLRGIEIEANVVLKATNVDGIYSADPAKDPQATFYQHLTYQQALEQELAVMDLAAFCQCRDHGMPLRVFNIHKPGALMRVVLTEDEGTTVTQGEKAHVE